MDSAVAGVWGKPKGWSASRRLADGRVLVSEWCTSPDATGNYDGQRPVVNTVYTFEMFVAKVPDGDTRAAPWVKR